jgi:hypothetical protein
MKLNTAFSSLIAAAFAALSIGAHAADAAPTEKMEKVEKADKPAPAKRHSHTAEKTSSTPMPAAPKPDAAANPASDETRHVHQRDAK